MLAEASIIYMDVVYAGNAGAISSASQKIMSFRAQREIRHRRPEQSEGSHFLFIFNYFVLPDDDLLFFKDKFVWNEFEQPEAGLKGMLQDVACKSTSPDKAKPNI
jgi:hypothetical protein